VEQASLFSLFEDALRVYNPWWEGESRDLPGFKRPLFEQLARDLVELRQIVSLTGPRRVGKSTLILQLIQHLLSEGHTTPDRVLYYSLDDPTLGVAPEGPRAIDAIVERFVDLRTRRLRSGQEGPVFVCLDEIQRFERWEQHLKKYFDLELPIRWMVTGSASSPIFKKSRESLLGRIKDYHLLPFSFREYLLFRCSERPALAALVEEAGRIREDVFRSFSGRRLAGSAADLHDALTAHEDFVQQAFRTFLVCGGFPEVWALPDPIRRQEYLFDNQVQKVIFEDLFYTTQFRKPDNVRRFYLYLITRPGDEISIDAVAGEIGVSRVMLERYLPLLEMTDLVRTIQKFSRKVLKVKRSNLKAYLVDLGVRNAVMKLDERLLADDTLLGKYAENLVFRTVLGWREKLEVSYYRERDREVDFVVAMAADRFLPIEVKYTTQARPPGYLRELTAALDQEMSLAVRRDIRPAWAEPVVELGLIEFLLIFG
jgi:predicted AAA+ superfamily ATPase